MRRFALIALLIVVTPLSARSQPLAERVPADALLYVGWRGSTDLGPKYEASHLKAVIESSGISQVVNDMLPKLMQKIKDENEHDPEAAVFSFLAKTLGKSVWEKPTALYIGPIDAAQPGPPIPKVAVMIESGAADGARIVTELNRMIQEEGGGDMVQASLAGKTVLITAGPIKPAERALLSGQVAGASLKTSAKFGASLSQVNPDPVAMVYADVESLLKMIEAVRQKQLEQMKQAGFEPGPNDEIVMMPKIIEALGLPSIKRVVYTGGFNGKDWGDDVFIEAPAPLTGLAKLLQAEPMSSDALKRIPKGAALAAAGRLDLARVWKEIRTTMTKIEPRATEEIDDMLAELRAQVGIALEADILRPLGDEWIIYTDQHVGGRGTMGLVAINKLREPARAQITLATIARKANELIAEEMGNEEMKIQIKTAKAGDLTISYLAVPFVTPAWTIHDGYLYVALYPQMLVSAVDHVKKGGPSLLDDPRFVALQKRVGAANGARAISWMDLPQTAGDGYQTTLMISRLAMGFADMFGVDAPMMLVPPLTKLEPHLSPAGSFVWSDAKGLHIRAISPFPGATLLGAQNNMMAGQYMMMLGVMMPAMMMVRQADFAPPGIAIGPGGGARAASSMANMRQIVTGCIVHAQTNKGNFPPDVATLVHESLIEPETVLASRAGVRVPDEFLKWEKKRQTEWINTNSSYCYVPGATDKLDGEKIVLFERLNVSNGRTIAAAFNDGHVESLTIEKARERIKKQTGKTLEQWSGLKRPGAGWPKGARLP